MNKIMVGFWTKKGILIRLKMCFVKWLKYKNTHILPLHKILGPSCFVFCQNTILLLVNAILKHCV